MTSAAIPCLRCRATAHVAPDATGAACPACHFGLPPPGAAAWMVGRDGAPPTGPYRIDQLAQLVQQGQLLPNDAVWHEGAPDWVPIQALPALATSEATPPIAPQPAYPQPAPAAYAPAPTAYHPAPRAPGKAMLHVKRALNWNLRSIPVEADERELLIANSVDEEDARRYLVWRRSVLLVVAPITLLSALLALLGSLTNEWSGLSVLGVLLELLRIAALFVLPLTAWLAARAWDRHRRSRNIMLRGWLVAFLTPLLLALFPFAWRVDMSAANDQVVGQVSAMLSLLGAISVYVTLMPAVLSLIPGVLRGCLRVKSLLPESMLPGWFLIASTPLYVLLFLVIFTTVNQLAGNLILMIAVLALLSAPLLYLLNANTFTRPLHTPEEAAKIGSIQTLAMVIVGGGLVLLVIYAFTAEVMGQALIGFSESSSILRPWSPSLLQFPIDYFVRSLFTTVLVADLFMLMNLSLWRHSKAFAQSPEAASYDRLMSEIEEAGERR